MIDFSGNPIPATFLVWDSEIDEYYHDRVEQEHLSFHSSSRLFRVAFIKTNKACRDVRSFWVTFMYTGDSIWRRLRGKVFSSIWLSQQSEKGYWQELSDFWWVTDRVTEVEGVLNFRSLTYVYSDDITEPLINPVPSLGRIWDSDLTWWHRLSESSDPFGFDTLGKPQPMHETKFSEWWKSWTWTLVLNSTLFNRGSVLDLWNLSLQDLKRKHCKRM